MKGIGEKIKIMILKKPRSKYTINIVEKDDLLYINYMEKNYNKPTKTNVIVKKDLPDWLKHFYEIGWIEQKKDA